MKKRNSGVTPSGFKLGERFSVAVSDGSEFQGLENNKIPTSVYMVPFREAKVALQGKISKQTINQQQQNRKGPQAKRLLWKSQGGTRSGSSDPSAGPDESVPGPVPWLVRRAGSRFTKFTALPRLPRPPRHCAGVIQTARRVQVGGVGGVFGVCDPPPPLPFAFTHGQNVCVSPLKTDRVAKGTSAWDAARVVTLYDPASLALNKPAARARGPGVLNQYEVIVQ